MAVAFSLSLLWASPKTPADHCHGHMSNAAIVRDVSKQLDKVLVEQNHCQGFKTVAINFEQISLLSPSGCVGSDKS